MTAKVLSIDPGAGGAIVYRDEDGIVTAIKMPEGMTGLCDKLRELAANGYTSAIVERVGTYVPGNSGPAAASFARHCGQLDAAIYLNGIAIIANPTPGQWMKRIGVPRFEEKPDRKRWLKEWAQRRFPSLTVTLVTADALAMLVAMIGENTNGI